MKENKILINIFRPIEEVFDFTINPQNTPLWIDGIVREETNDFPIKVGTEYKNVNQKGDWTEYVVVKFEPNKIFELKQKDNNYHVQYTYEKVSENETGLTYFEWVEHGELENPFIKNTLEKLKMVLEK
ncbi:MAG: SRPBCC family protein [Patescibacteria group bacterium]